MNTFHDIMENDPQEEKRNPFHWTERINQLIDKCKASNKQIELLTQGLAEAEIRCLKLKQENEKLGEALGLKDEPHTLSSVGPC